MKTYFIVISISLLPVILRLFYLARDMAIKNIKFRNDLLSSAYLIKDLGPNTAAFSVVSLFTAPSESYSVLITVAFVGICLHFAGRKLRDFIYKHTTDHKKEFRRFKEMLKKDD